MSIKTVTQPTAVRLKEAGFEQSSGKINYHWVRFKKESFEPKYYSEPWHTPCLWPNVSEPDEVIAAAPTSDEILEQLPEEIKNNDDWLTIQKANNAYCIMYDLCGEPKPYFDNESLPEALAAMWLWLKQQGLLNEGER